VGERGVFFLAVLLGYDTITIKPRSNDELIMGDDSVRQAED
jgi:hypothetical protein